jgi:hypothetical protein
MTETTISISKYKIPILTGIDNYYEWKSETQDAILAMGAPSFGQEGEAKSTGSRGNHVYQDWMW